MPGFFVSDVAPEYEQWLESERDRLRALATKSAWSLVDSSVERRDATAALFWARRALGIVPDDESALRKFLGICDRVGDRAAALRLAEEHKPDLILMDINMPDMDGYTLTTKIKSMPGLARVPILALTANVMRGDKEKTLEAGCDGYIQKPLDVDQLVREIEKFLTRRANV